MIAEFLAGLRGFLGSTGINFSNPLVLFLLIVAIYVLWRRTRRT
jgi:hypothetical protein